MLELLSILQRVKPSGKTPVYALGNPILPRARLFVVTRQAQAAAENVPADHDAEAASLSLCAARNHVKKTESLIVIIRQFFQRFQSRTGTETPALIRRGGLLPPGILL